LFHRNFCRFENIDILYLTSVGVIIKYLLANLGRYFDERNTATIPKIILLRLPIKIQPLFKLFFMSPMAPRTIRIAPRGAMVNLKAMERFLCE
jgi:hypothetical protein